MGALRYLTNTDTGEDLMELLKKKKDKKPKANGIELNVDTTGMSEEEIAAMEAAKVLEQYDRESAFRNGLPKGISLVISAILIADVDALLF